VWSVNNIPFELKYYKDVLLVVIREVTAQDVCIPGYPKKVRAVPAWLKRQAYAEYGITQYKTGDYEVDHSIEFQQIAVQDNRLGIPPLIRYAPRFPNPFLRYAQMLCTGPEDCRIQGLKTFCRKS
jgi:hypothetical protein